MLNKNMCLIKIIDRFGNGHVCGSIETMALLLSGGINAWGSQAAEAGLATTDYKRSNVNMDIESRFMSSHTLRRA